jgi:hypothetical protein
VPTDPPGDLALTPLNGEPRPLSGWLLTFHLAVVVLDPFTRESAWLLETAGRILDSFSEADCRVAFIVTSTSDEARQFLGPWTERLLVFVDPDRAVVKGLGLNELPAFVHLRQDGHIVGAAEGWDPDEWRAVADALAEMMSWSSPLIPASNDPLPYAGSAALG